MSANRILCGWIVAAGIVAVGPVFGATLPPKGLYASFDYVHLATGSDCVQSTGDAFRGHLDWPGAGKTGAVWRYGIPTGIRSATGPQIEKISYPKTPTKTSWSGTENYDFEPSGVDVGSHFRGDAHLYRSGLLRHGKNDQVRQLHRGDLFDVRRRIDLGRKNLRTTIRPGDGAGAAGPEDDPVRPGCGGAPLGRYRIGRLHLRFLAAVLLAAAAIGIAYRYLLDPRIGRRAS